MSEREKQKKKDVSKKQNVPQAKTIRGQLAAGNRVMIGQMSFLIVFFIICMIFIFICQRSVVDYAEKQQTTSEVILEVNGWMDELENSIRKGTVFENETEIENTGFQKFYYIASEERGRVSQRAEEAEEIYVEIFNSGKKALADKQSDSAAALKMLEEEILPKQAELRELLAAISSSYGTMVNQAISIVLGVIIICIVMGIIVAILMIRRASINGNKMALQISTPVNEVADWAEHLSTGADNLEVNTESLDKVELEEVKRMIKSFLQMAESISDNVKVVKKVADGDMTAFVNIRSSSDSLGKNLYRMVQNNDMMFAEITGIADSMKEEAKAIAEASQALAENCMMQTEKIMDFRGDIDKTGDLINENSKDAEEAFELSNVIKQEVDGSIEKMEELVSAMEEIRTASERVSSVIADIEEIASQTNLLALNAAIEAARAGEAGKGFAVVADSVRELAEKSAMAATESKKLIGDTIDKTGIGSELSGDTFEAFQTITESTERIIAVTKSISESGMRQKDYMGEIEKNVAEISDVISGNAAASQETAAMSAEINKSAEVLKTSMGQFNLRKRTPGKPYIPPEKEKDKEFIRIATQNFERFINSDKGKEWMSNL